MKFDDALNEVQTQIVNRLTMANWVKTHADFIKSLECSIDIYEDKVDFNSLTHEKVILVVEKFPGIWIKDYNESTINYLLKNAIAPGLTLRLWGGAPPPSCKIIEVEEIVPAKTVPEQRRIVRKLQCIETEPAA